MDTIAAPPPPSSTQTPTKSRSFSDPPNATNTAAPSILAPSPTFRERISNPVTSRHDHDVSPTSTANEPTTPKPKSKSNTLRRPLSLQMPSPSQFPSAHHRSAPLSPQLDRGSVYMSQQQQQQLGYSHESSPASYSPATSLPRHSRGLDLFSRASTNLHHSTLAQPGMEAHSLPRSGEGWRMGLGMDGSTPNSSPFIGSGGGAAAGGGQKPLLIPKRKASLGGNSMVLDSPIMAPSRSTMSSSVGSVNMLGMSESEGSDGSDEADEVGRMRDEEDEDPIFTTPQVHKLQNPSAPTPFVGGRAPSTPLGDERRGSLWGTGVNFSPAQASLMKTIRRSRLQGRGSKKNRKSSSSASNSGYSSMNSPRNTSPPPLRSIESAANNSYFNTNWPTTARSRRESLALGTDGLHLSSGNDSGDEASANTGSPATPSTPGVIRRPVTRRQNLLPKTKGFARIRAALLEEAAPIDTEVRREAETIRQVRERDGSIAELDLTPSGHRSGQAAADPSSPTLLPAVPEGGQKDLIANDETPHAAKGLGVNFAAHASRNSGGMEYWNRPYDPSLRTPPPPPPNFTRQGTSISSDINMDNVSISETPPGSSGLQGYQWRPRPRARSSASDAPPSSATSESPALTNTASGTTVMNDDMHLNRFKRRREDDFDISTIKRRAVSPGMSANNSPVLTQSPSLKDPPSAGAGWGGPPGPPAERTSSKDAGRSSTGGSNSISATTSGEGSGGSVAGVGVQQVPSRQGSGGSSMSLASGMGTPTNGAAPGSSGGGGPGGKKLGLQGMVDTNAELMKMSIE